MAEGKKDLGWFLWESSKEPEKAVAWLLSAPFADVEAVGKALGEEWLVRATLVQVVRLVKHVGGLPGLESKTEPYAEIAARKAETERQLQEMDRAAEVTGKAVAAAKRVFPDAQPPGTVKDKDGAIVQDARAEYPCRACGVMVLLATALNGNGSSGIVVLESMPKPSGAYALAYRKSENRLIASKAHNKAARSFDLHACPGKKNA